MSVSFDDFDQEPTKDSYADIRKNAHVVNGGEATFQCPACKGSKVFRSYTGRVVGNCFKCKGNGTVSKAVAAQAKGVETRKANVRKFNEAHEAEYKYLLERHERGFNLASDLLRKWRENETLTDNQVALVRKLMAEDAARKAEYAAKREVAAPTVDLTAIDALFATAVDNQIKRPIFRTVDFDISKAPMTGRNAGALYVTARDDEGTYLGKLMGGKFFASREAPKDTAEKLLEVAADPTDAAIKYGRKTGRCGCCGRVLVDPISILAVVGPICATKWGLEFRRNLAETEYANMKAEEIARIAK